MTRSATVSAPVGRPGPQTNGDNATTTFDLQHDHRHVVVYPATVDTYAVTVAAPAVRMLAATLTEIASILT